MNAHEIKFAQTRERDHYLVNDGLYSAPTGYTPYNFPHIPRGDKPRDPSALSGPYFDVTTPGWITDQMPYIGFVPAENPIYANWLRPLRYNFQTLPVQRRDDGRFELRPEVQKEWDTLERNFRSLLSAAMSESNLNLPHPFRIWSYPCQYGYTRTHKTESTARRRALASKSAFMPLMAALLFFTHALVQQKPLQYTKKSVVSQLAQIRDISETWSSYIGNNLLNAPFTGGYIDCSAKGMTRWIPLLQSSRMPLCLYWGPVSRFIPKLIHGKLTGLYPDSKAIEYLREHTEQRETNSLQHLLYVQETKLNKKQNAGQTMEEFFESRLKQNGILEQKETKEQRHRRMQLLQHSQRDLPPGDGSRTKVFLWTLHDGRRVREAVTKGDYIREWTSYGPKQRRYDPFHNEWDICTDFDPNDVPTDLDDFSDDDAVDRYPDDNPPITPGYTAGEYLGRLHRPTIPTPIHKPPHFGLSIREISYRTLGFLPFALHYPRGHKSDMNLARHVLGLSRVPYEAAMSESESENLLDLLDSIKHAKSLKDLPPICDLCDKSNSIHQPWPFKLTYRHIDGGIWILCGTEADRINLTGRFVVGLTSAMAVLGIVRSRIGGKKEDIVEALVEQGSTFRTIVAHEMVGGDTTDMLPKTPGQPPIIRNIVRLDDDPSSPSGCRARLGFRSHNHKFTLADFQAYVEMRDNFLSTPRGRAAILAGGLLARLAKNAVHEQDVYNGTITGFVESWSNGAGLLDPHDKKMAFWDDRLTEEEVNLVCGVYEVATGPVLGNGTIQTAEVSWFPKPGAWKGSGLNHGYWSRDAEIWYRDRLQKIQGGNAQLFTNAKWKVLVKFNKNARKILDRAEQFAQEYLHERLQSRQEGRSDSVA
ncbi:hypothetical protein V5O48_009205 [Marasmius crinis-equi]|uniref:Uncharacterized protein n=1 Tax=Marasmius crinis-equi TaxID=585013 RepID=A0ABR3FBR2_9AGAR